MTDEAKEARKAYWRQYYQSHKTQKKEYMARYWQRRADAAKAQAEAEATQKNADNGKEEDCSNE